jgi:hypothetical protein
MLLEFDRLASKKNEFYVKKEICQRAKHMSQENKESILDKKRKEI